MECRLGVLGWGAGWESRSGIAGWLGREGGGRWSLPPMMAVQACRHRPGWGRPYPRVVLGGPRDLGRLEEPCSPTSASPAITPLSVENEPAMRARTAGRTTVAHSPLKSQSDPAASARRHPLSNPLGILDAHERECISTSRPECVHRRTECPALPSVILGCVPTSSPPPGHRSRILFAQGRASPNRGQRFLKVLGKAHVRARQQKCGLKCKNVPVALDRPQPLP